MALSTENTSELTQDVVASILTEPLQRFSTFLQSGVRFFDTRGGNTLRIPRGFSSVADEIDADNWHAENEQINEVDPEVGDELTLLPSTMQSIKTITRFSNELARQSVQSLEQALQNRLVSDVATVVDRQFLGSDGDGVTQPRGMFAWEGVQELERPAAGLDFDTIMDAYGVFLGNRGHTQSLRLFIRPDDYMALRKLKDTTGRYLLEPDLKTGGIVVPALGATLAISNHIPEGNAGLVDTAQIAVARDLDPSVKILTERYADYDQQAIRIVARYDAGLMEPTAMVKITAAE